MDGTGRTGVSRWVRLLVLTLAIVLPIDGVLAYIFGAPAWMGLLYIGLGLALGALGLRLNRARRRKPVAALAETPVRTPEPPRRAIGYVCVSEASNGDLREQTEALKACCEERGLLLTSVVHDVDSGGREQRPSLAWALEQIAGDRAETLVVARLRDLSSNVANLAPLLSWFNSDKRTLVAIDLRLDTSTEAGRLAAGAIAGVGGWEHERISERTRRGLEAARSRGTSQGRTAVADIPELQERIIGMREEGMTLQAIADALNAEGVPTLRGGAMWRPSSVQRATGYRRPSSGPRGIELPKPGPSER